MNQSKMFQTFFNPSGFIEHHFMGAQTPESMAAAIAGLVKRAAKLKANHKKALILVDATSVPRIDTSGKMDAARQQAVDVLCHAKYDRIAVYGDTDIQMLVSVLAMVADRSDKVKAFPDRAVALKWLKTGK